MAWTQIENPGSATANRTVDSLDCLELHNFEFGTKMDQDTHFELELARFCLSVWSQTCCVVVTSHFSLVGSPGPMLLPV